MDSSIEQRLAEFTEFERALTAQKGHDSELAQVLITATFLDNQLRTILEAFLVEDRSSVTFKNSLFDGPSAPVGAISSRIKVAYALGLIDEREYGSINAIRDVRNLFAHRLTIRFADTKMTGAFDRLAWAAGRESAGKLDRSEIMFMAAVRLAMDLMNRADHVALERRIGKEWPKHRTDVVDHGDFDPLDRDTRDLDGSWAEFYDDPTGRKA